MDCKICEGPAVPFDSIELAKSCNGPPDKPVGVAVDYIRCTRCAFIFTSHFDDYSGDRWKDEIYNDEYYSTIDPDYAETRPRWNAVQVGTMVPGRRDEVVGLDYGGGNGRTAEILRERGYAYDSYDPYGTNQLTPGRKGTYDFCSAFEVAEHTIDPCGMMAEIVRMASPGPLIVLIGTLVHDHEVNDESRLDWWYAAPRNGHVSLYSYQALRTLGERFGLSLISFNASQHVFLRGHALGAVRRRVLTRKIRHRLVGMLPGRR